MTLKMLAAYYSCGCDSRELFAGLKIENDKSFPEYLNRFDVIYLNMQLDDLFLRHVRKDRRVWCSLF